MLKAGLIINPVAGIGGRVGLKGSDGAEIQSQALAMGAEPLADQRVKETLSNLDQSLSEITWLCANGAMGADLLTEMEIPHQVIYHPASQTTTPEDTVSATATLHAHEVDLLLFAGGDGTARDVMNGLQEEQLCLGISLFKITVTVE